MIKVIEPCEGQWWNPLTWGRSHCWHYLKSERVPILCKNGVPLHKFYYEANLTTIRITDTYNIYVCCKCPQTKREKEDEYW